MNYKTEQESFWAGQFGDNYIDRNKSKNILASNTNFLSSALKRTSGIKNCIEFGSNIGNNLKALNYLLPEVDKSAIEINPKAISQLKEVVSSDNIFEGSILDYQPIEKFDLVLIKGVLIHLDPKYLEAVYQKLVCSCKKYLLIAEYYNPTPVTINYRGHQNKLFKRDFAGELMDSYPFMILSDYGFCYHRDPIFPADDYTWFLLKNDK